jgi:capsular polysaccharide biosynthesis protein
MAQRTSVEKLRVMADDVDRRREEYNKSAARAAELRQESEVADSGVTPLGAAVTPQDPKFPNKPLLIGVGFGAGLALGFLISLAMELFGRRIRSYQDLQVAIKVPVLAVVARPKTRTGLHLRARLMRGLARSRGGRKEQALA